MKGTEERLCYFVFCFLISNPDFLGYKYFLTADFCHLIDLLCFPVGHQVTLISYLIKAETELAQTDLWSVTNSLPIFTFWADFPSYL